MEAADFEGLQGPAGTEQERRYEEELVGRYGEATRATVRQGRRRWAAMTPAQVAEAKAEMTAVHAELAALAAEGVPPGDPRALAVTARHHRWVCLSWTPDAAAYRSLGELYAESPDLRAVFDAVRPGLADYLRAATAAYADAAL